MKIALGISGASGAPIAERLIQVLSEKVEELHIVISDTAKAIFKEETGSEIVEFLERLKFTKAILYQNNDMHSPLSSGSFKIDACVIAPCSMRTLAAIAHGISDTLIARCGDVAIKQKHKLVLVPRETPLSPIHLKNMLTLANLGASIVIPALTFYNKPKRLEDAVDFVVGKVLDELSIDNELYKRWGY